MTDAEILSGKITKLILEWVEERGSNKNVLDITEALLKTIADFPFVETCIDQHYYMRHKAEILGGRVEP